MDSKLRKYLHHSLFDKQKPHVYVVSVNSDKSLKNIYKAYDAQLEHGEQSLPLRYYAVKRVLNSNHVTHYVYRTVNKEPTTLDYTSF